MYSTVPRAPVANRRLTTGTHGDKNHQDYASGRMTTRGTTSALRAKPIRHQTSQNIHMMNSVDNRNCGRLVNDADEDQYGMEPYELMENLRIGGGPKEMMNQPTYSTMRTHAREEMKS